MIRSLTLCSVLAVAAIANAQPVLTFATNAPMPGHTYTLHYGAYVDEGAAGADQTWDLSTLTSDSTNVITLVDPATTTNGATFPTATVAETGAVAIMYFRAAADGMYLAGSDADGLLIPYSDEGRYLPYPCAYTDTWTDDAAAEFTVETFTVNRTGTITGEADGYGTLIMPTWSAQDVLRIHWHEEATDMNDQFPVGIESVYDSYLYYVVGQSYPIAQLVHTETTVLGNTITSEHAQWVDELSTSTRDGMGISENLGVFPVPTSDQLNIILPATMDQGCTLTVTDAQGRKVTETRVNALRTQLDVRSLTPGLYMLTATNAGGMTATSRFVAE